ncbi:MAG: hypothetical protein JSR59_12540 [Proteobacteria bacterium]|nr:hypothetical protein [Pseudomonadota bacterium]
MRGKIDLLSEDMQLVKGRSTSLEAQVAGLHNQVALVHGDMATVHGRRLDLADESR